MKQIHSTFLGRVGEVRTMLRTAHVTDSKGGYEKERVERALITEACFLSLFVALEEFLEASFAHYLTGKMSTARWRPGRFAKPPTRQHAHDMLLGTQRYVDWSTPSTVAKFAELYFVNGEPFSTALAGVQGHLQSMKTVRNSTAHLSITTRSALEALYARWTGVPTAGIYAYEMLMATHSSQGNTFYDESEKVVLGLASNIANRT